MPNSGVAITPGVGANIAVNATNDLDYQVIKIDAGADGASYPIVGDGTHGLPVQVTQVQGVVVVNNPTAANLKVDASGATVPVSAASALPVSAPASAPVCVEVVIGGASALPLPVTGNVTANQGDGAAASDPWPTSLTDGTNGVAAIAAVSAVNALCVKVLSTPGAGALADGATFTEGATTFDAIGGEYNTGAGAATSGKAAACQITQYRGLHVNLRASGGTEIGTSGAPVRVDPTGTTTQPVSGTVTATLSTSTNAGAAANTADYDTGAGTDTMTMFGVAVPANGGAVPGGTSTAPLRVDPTGTTTQPVNLTDINGSAVLTVASGVMEVGIANARGAVVPASTGVAANAVPVQSQPPASGFWKSHIVLAASQTSQVVHTPASGKTSYILSIQLTCRGARGWCRCTTAPTQPRTCCGLPPSPGPS